MKPTLLAIKRKTNVTTKAIASQAQLLLADVFTVETGGYCSKDRVQQVLDAFNQLSGRQIRVDDIHFLTPLQQQQNASPLVNEDRTIGGTTRVRLYPHTSQGHM